MDWRTAASPLHLRDPRARDLAARHLGHLDPAIDADARRRRFDPRVLNAIAQARDVAIAQRTCFDRIDVLFLGQLAAQFGLALLARMLVGRALELFAACLACGRLLACAWRCASSAARAASAGPAPPLWQHRRPWSAPALWRHPPPWPRRRPWPRLAAWLAAAACEAACASAAARARCAASAARSICAR